MKPVFYIIFLLFLCIVSSCKESNIDNIVSVDSQSDGIQCIDGVLHFATVNDFDKTIDLLTAKNADLKSFEERHNFKSLSSYVENISSILNDIDDVTIYKKALNEYKKFVIYDESLDYVKPAIDALGYASVANSEGKYYIGGILYEVTPDYLLVHSATTRSTVPDKLEYKMTPQMHSETRGENTEIFSDLSYTHDGDRRLFTDVKSIMYWTLVSSSNNENTYSARYSFQFHIRAQKKNWVGKWKDYNTVCMFDNLVFVFEIPGQSNWWEQIKSSDYVTGDDGYYESGEVVNYTLTFNSIRDFTTHDFYRPYGVLIRYRARTRGTGNCGAVVNQGVTSSPWSVLDNCM